MWTRSAKWFSIKHTNFEICHKINITFNLSEWNKISLCWWCKVYWNVLLWWFYVCSLLNKTKSILYGNKIIYETSGAKFVTTRSYLTWNSVRIFVYCNSCQFAILQLLQTNFSRIHQFIRIEHIHQFKMPAKMGWLRHVLTVLSVAIFVSIETVNNTRI